jgi:hypothetical protein
MQLLDELKPSVLILDLHLPEKLDFMPDFVKSRLSSIRLIAVSVANDVEARSLATSYGALELLDSLKLYNDLIPAILNLSKSGSETLPTDTGHVTANSSGSDAE